MALQAAVGRHRALVVGFSGGVDSTLVAHVATGVLGARAVLCVTAVSASLGPGEEEHCRALATSLGLRFATVATAELEDPVYVANGSGRCARCKEALMDALAPLAEAEGAAVALGVNCDDLFDHRPGQGAAAARGAVFPLVEAGLDKAQVRAVSRQLGLSTWDRPAAPCLASRIPYGTPVTLERLGAVGRAEAALRDLGLPEVRVRHHGAVARIEVPEAALATALERRLAITEAVRAAGFAFVALDLEGLSSGRMNRLLRAGERP